MQIFNQINGIGKQNLYRMCKSKSWAPHQQYNISIWLSKQVLILLVMDTLKPELYQINGICYRINPGDNVGEAPQHYVENGLFLCQLFHKPSQFFYVYKMILHINAIAFQMIWNVV